MLIRLKKYYVNWKMAGWANAIKSKAGSESPPCALFLVNVQSMTVNGSVTAAALNPLRWEDRISKENLVCGKLSERVRMHD